MDGPALGPNDTNVVLKYRRSGMPGELLGYATRVAGSPQALMVEFPRDSILAPLASFTRGVRMIGLIGIALSLLLAWILSRRLTQPLERLTAAAKAITTHGGPVAPRIAMDRADELGTLGDAFDTMAQQVADSRQRLEEKVLERTEALNVTLAQLQEAQEALIRREKLATRASSRQASPRAPQPARAS